MSNQIKSKLKTIREKLVQIRQEVLDGKRKIAYALKENGYEQVNPFDDNSSTYDTFEHYAELILGLNSKNSMIFEYSIPNHAATAYKRTVVLPMEFGSNGVPNTSLNDIAREIIAKETAAQASEEDIALLSAEDDAMPMSYDEVWEVYSEEQTPANNSIPTTTDSFGNECLDGEYLFSIEDLDVLTDEQKDEFIDAAIALNATVETEETTVRRARAARQYAPSKGVNIVYNYSVDWGDGARAAYIDGESYETNKLAIWHTYAKGGVYHISIKGTYRTIKTEGHQNGDFTYNGALVKDTDGETLKTSFNYGTINYLTNVKSWGNTLLTNCANAFRYTLSLISLPIPDASEPFSEVTSFANMFYYSGIQTLPYNANTKKGIFSNSVKVTDMSNMFANCSQLTGPLPEKLIDGCISVTNMSNMFANCPRLKGSLPEGFLVDMGSLTDTTEMFSNDTSLDGELPRIFFKNCTEVTTINRMFYNCSNLKGTIHKEFMAGLTSLQDASQAFWGCKSITGINKDAFIGITSDSINFRETFYNCGFLEIPSGLLSGLTGKNLKMEKMFSDCADLTNIGADNFLSIKPCCARGIFGGAPNLNCDISEADDWKSYRTIKKWYGAFAGSANLTIDGVPCPLELNAIGTRKYLEGNVGKIVLQDDTLVEPKDYTYNSSNKPKGIIFADVYLDISKTNATIANKSGNLVEDGAEGSVRKLLACTLNDGGSLWVDARSHAEDIPFITNSMDVNVSYYRMEYGADGSQTMPQLRYCGEEYDRAIAQWCVEKGYASNMTDGTYTKYEYNESAASITSSDASKLYFKRDDDFANSHKYIAYANAVRKEEFDITLNKIKCTRYPAMNLCHSYTNGVEDGTCYLPDATELWDQTCLKTFIATIMNLIINSSTAYTVKNTYPLVSSWYWTSVESGMSAAWRCSVGYMYVHNWISKWGWRYVRPCFSIKKPSVSA